MAVMRNANKVKKTELHAMEQAAVVYVHILDTIFGGIAPGWTPALNGLNFQTRRSAEDETTVEVRPVGWNKKSRILCRFTKKRNGWATSPYLIELECPDIPQCNGLVFYGLTSTETGFMMTPSRLITIDTPKGEVKIQCETFGGRPR
jgi:hypothetical protein